MFGAIFTYVRFSSFTPEKNLFTACASFHNDTIPASAIRIKCCFTIIDNSLSLIFSSILVVSMLYKACIVLGLGCNLEVIMDI